MIVAERCCCGASIDLAPSPRSDRAGADRERSRVAEELRAWRRMHKACRDRAATVGRVDCSETHRLTAADRAAAAAAVRADEGSA